MNARGNRRPPWWERGGQEPALAELLADPIMTLVLNRDGLTRQDVIDAVRLARRNLARQRSDTSDETVPIAAE